MYKSLIDNFYYCGPADDVVIEEDLSLVLGLRHFCSDETLGEIIGDEWIPEGYSGNFLYGEIRNYGNKPISEELKKLTKYYFYMHENKCTDRFYTGPFAEHFLFSLMEMITHFRTIYPDLPVYLFCDWFDFEDPTCHIIYQQINTYLMPMAFFLKGRSRKVYGE